MDLSIGPTECFRDIAAGIHQSKQSKRDQGKSHTVFYDIASEFSVISALPHWLHRPSVICVGGDYQEMEIIGGRLGDWLPPYIITLIVKRDYSSEASGSYRRPMQNLFDHCIFN